MASRCGSYLRVVAAEETVVGVVLEHDEDHMFDGSGWGCLDARCSYRLSARQFQCQTARGDGTASNLIAVLRLIGWDPARSITHLPLIVGSQWSRQAPQMVAVGALCRQRGVDPMNCAHSTRCRITASVLSRLLAKIQALFRPLVVRT